jgi:hypothetical protein
MQIGLLHEKYSLAGDSSQRVIEGTEFRLEEIRSVGYFFASSDRHDSTFEAMIGFWTRLQHSWIFKYFPGSAKQLKKDRGLFKGSRPGVLHKVNKKELAVFLSDKLKGTVVFVHDESAHYWRQVLGD